MGGNTDDDVLFVDQQQQPTDDNTRLPNSHSAALVMAFIFLCVFAYCAYRFLRNKCCPPKERSIYIEGYNEGDCAVRGLEDIIKEREDYLAIYGNKCIKSVSAAVSKNERTESTAVGPFRN